MSLKTCEKTIQLITSPFGITFIIFLILQVLFLCLARIEHLQNYSIINKYVITNGKQYAQTRFIMISFYAL